jgi:NAD(P)-dependent dehydrogenase (short-subunit alcohol dehydrogenase family)
MPPMELGLRERVVVITGAGAGIGLAVAQAFAHEGSRVVGGDVDPAALGRVEGEVLAVEVDLAAAGGPERLVQNAVDAHGAVDVLVNALGGPTRRGSFVEISDNEWLRTLELNLLGMIRASRAAIPHMLAQRRGAIVSIASDAGRQPDPIFVDYCVWKAAVLNLSKSLSIELGPVGIRSNAVSPGPTRTPGFVDFFERASHPGLTTEQVIEQFTVDRRIALGKLGEPADVAGVVVFLASDLAKQVTGSEYCVDGGVIHAA